MILSGKNITRYTVGGRTLVPSVVQTSNSNQVTAETQSVQNANLLLNNQRIQNPLSSTTRVTNGQNTNTVTGFNPNTYTESQQAKSINVPSRREFLLNTNTGEKNFIPLTSSTVNTHIRLPSSPVLINSQIVNQASKSHIPGNTSTRQPTTTVSSSIPVTGNGMMPGSYQTHHSSNTLPNIKGIEYKPPNNHQLYQILPNEASIKLNTQSSNVIGSATSDKGSTSLTNYQTQTTPDNIRTNPLRQPTPHNIVASNNVLSSEYISPRVNANLQMTPPSGQITNLQSPNYRLTNPGISGIGNTQLSSSPTTDRDTITTSVSSHQFSPGSQFSTNSKSAKETYSNLYRNNSLPSSPSSLPSRVNIIGSNSNFKTNTAGSNVLNVHKHSSPPQPVLTDNTQLNNLVSSSPQLKQSIIVKNEQHVNNPSKGDSHIIKGQSITAPNNIIVVSPNALIGSTEIAAHGNQDSEHLRNENPIQGSVNSGGAGRTTSVKPNDEIVSIPLEADIEAHVSGKVLTKKSDLNNSSIEELANGLLSIPIAANIKGHLGNALSNSAPVSSGYLQLGNVLRPNNLNLETNSDITTTINRNNEVKMELNNEGNNTSIARGSLSDGHMPDTNVTLDTKASGYNQENNPDSSESSGRTKAISGGQDSSNKPSLTRTSVNSNVTTETTNPSTSLNIESETSLNQETISNSQNLKDLSLSSTDSEVSTDGQSNISAPNFYLSQEGQINANENELLPQSSIDHSEQYIAPISDQLLNDIAVNSSFQNVDSGSNEQQFISSEADAPTMVSPTGPGINSINVQGKTNSELHPIIQGNNINYPAMNNHNIPTDLTYQQSVPSSNTNVEEIQNNQVQTSPSERNDFIYPSSTQNSPYFQNQNVINSNIIPEEANMSTLTSVHDQSVDNVNPHSNSVIFSHNNLPLDDNIESRVTTVDGNPHYPSITQDINYNPPYSSQPQTALSDSNTFGHVNLENSNILPVAIATNMNVALNNKDQLTNNNQPGTSLPQNVEIFNYQGNEALQPNNAITNHADLILREPITQNTDRNQQPDAHGRLTNNNQNVFYPSSVYSAESPNQYVNNIQSFHHPENSRIYPHSPQPNSQYSMPQTQQWFNPYIGNRAQESQNYLPPIQPYFSNNPVPQLFTNQTVVETYEKKTKTTETRTPYVAPVPLQEYIDSGYYTSNIPYNAINYGPQLNYPTTETSSQLYKVPNHNYGDGKIYNVPFTSANKESYSLGSNMGMSDSGAADLSSRQNIHTNNNNIQHYNPNILHTNLDGRLNQNSNNIPQFQQKVNGQHNNHPIIDFRGNVGMSGTQGAVLIPLHTTYYNHNELIPQAVNRGVQLNSDSSPSQGNVVNMAHTNHNFIEPIHTYYSNVGREIPPSYSLVQGSQVSPSVVSNSQLNSNKAAAAIQYHQHAENQNGFTQNAVPIRNVASANSLPSVSVDVRGQPSNHYLQGR